MNSLKATSFLFFIFLNSSAFAKGLSHRCGSETVASVSFSWCMDSYGPDNPDLIYYLHPSDHSPQSWLNNEENQNIRRDWKRTGKDFPTVISISFGPEWSLTDIAHPPRPALYSLFVDDVLPLMEKKLKNKMAAHHGRRFLFGVSMGGFNAAMLYLKSGHLFDRTVLVCPAISSLRPHALPEEVESYVRRHRPYLDPEALEELQNWEALEFSSPQDWERHDAIQLATHLTAQAPPIHVECGREDEYGFFEGASAFVSAARNAGVRAEWEPLVGGHCVFNTHAIVQFLTR